MSSRRSFILGTGLVLTLAATWYVAGVDEAGDDLLTSPQRTAPSARSAAPGASVVARKPAETSIGRAGAQREAPQAERMSRGGGDLFATQSWQPPPPPLRSSTAPPLATPAPPLRAPELPYRYLGRMEEDGRVIAFLAEGAQLRPRVVRQGDLLPNYRVDEITSLGMRLTYLPLNETQRLLFGTTP